MAEKFKVKVYYEYAMEVEVEADSIKEAYDKGYDIIESEDYVGTPQYIGYNGGEVYDKEGNVHEIE